MEEKPLFVLRPHLVVAVIPMILGSLFVGVITGVLFGLFLRSFLIGLIGFIIMGFGSFLFGFLNLKARKYVFYKDKAEFYEGFLNIIKRTVRYEKVTDSVLVKTVWDRLFGTGTIRLVTAGHEMIGRTSVGGGIVIQYIDNPDEVYSKLEKLLKI